MSPWSRTRRHEARRWHDTESERCDAGSGSARCHRLLRTRPDRDVPPQGALVEMVQLVLEYVTAADGPPEDGHFQDEAQYRQGPALEEFLASETAGEAPLHVLVVECGHLRRRDGPSVVRGLKETGDHLCLVLVGAPRVLLGVGVVLEHPGCLVLSENVRATVTSRSWAPRVRSIARAYPTLGPADGLDFPHVADAEARRVPDRVPSPERSAGHLGIRRGEQGPEPPGRCPAAIARPVRSRTQAQGAGVVG